MQRFHLPDGTTIAFSNGAMWTVYFACYAASAERRPPEGDEEDAVLEWLKRQWEVADNYATAFDLQPMESEVAAPRRLAFFAELLRVLADDLAGDGEPDEMLWNLEVAWNDPERRAHWLERLDMLARVLETIRFAAVIAPRGSAR